MHTLKASCIHTYLHHDFHSYLPYPTHILHCRRNWRCLQLPLHTHTEHFCKLTPHLSYHPVSVTQEMPEELTANTFM